MGLLVNGGISAVYAWLEVSKAGLIVLSSLPLMFGLFALHGVMTGLAVGALDALVRVTFLRRGWPRSLALAGAGTVAAGGLVVVAAWRGVFTGPTPGWSVALNVIMYLVLPAVALGWAYWTLSGRPPARSEPGGLRDWARRSFVWSMPWMTLFSVADCYAYATGSLWYEGDDPPGWQVLAEALITAAVFAVALSGFITLVIICVDSRRQAATRGRAQCKAGTSLWEAAIVGGGVWLLMWVVLSAGWVIAVPSYAPGWVAAAAAGVCALCATTAVGVRRAALARSRAPD